MADGDANGMMVFTASDECLLWLHTDRVWRDAPEGDPNYGLEFVDRNGAALCPTQVYDGDDPVGFVVSMKSQAPACEWSQRAMVAARLANMPAHRPPSKDKSANLPTYAVSQPRGRKHARRLRTVGAERRAVRDHGTHDLVRAVERGEVAVGTAAYLTALPIEQQQEVLTRGEQELSRIAKQIRAGRPVARHAETVKRATEISQRTAPPLATESSAD